MQREHSDLADRFVFLTGGIYGAEERAFLEQSGRRTLTKPVTGDTLAKLLEGA